MKCTKENVHLLMVIVGFNQYILAKNNGTVSDSVGELLKRLQ